MNINFNNPLVKGGALTVVDLGVSYGAFKVASSFVDNNRALSVLLGLTAAATTCFATNFAVFSADRKNEGFKFDAKDIALRSVFGPLVYVVEAIGLEMATMLGAK